MLIGEVKINPKKIDIQQLKKKATKLISKHSKYEVTYIYLIFNKIYTIKIY